MKVYMFHYVTDNFKYYHFDKKFFEETVRRLASTKKIINLRQLEELESKKEKINDDYVMLTFDDGTVDHYKHVYPILKKYNAPGLFFLCSNVIKEEILDIQYIHQLLIKSNVNEIYLEVQDFMKKNNVHVDNIINMELHDWKERYVKQLLQTALPDVYRKELLEGLIRKYKISTDFKEYYMTIDNILEMKRNNMEFGCHTSTHKRLASLNEKEQTKEIKENMELLYKSNILDEQDVLSIAYPFGNYNDITIKVIEKLKFEFAFTTKEENLCKIKKYEISRLDCNILKEKL